MHKSHNPRAKPTPHGHSKVISHSTSRRGLKHRAARNTRHNKNPKSLTKTQNRLFSNFRSDLSVVDQIPSLASSITPTTPRVAIVGSGPAAMYTAKYILQLAPTTHVHIIDRLHTPFGLVRNGIAPDHPEAKNVIADFQTNVLANQRTTFIGGVKIKESRDQSNDDSSLTISDLYKHYHGVVIATGASTGKHLGIPHDKTGGVFDSHNFVSWYNGHPDYSSLNPPLNKAKNAIIVGNGNVSLDIARILLSPKGYLNNSDIPINVRDVLKNSSVQNVFLCARRGVLDAAYTIAELREILTLTTKKWGSQEEGVETEKSSNNVENNTTHQSTHQETNSTNHNSNTENSTTATLNNAEPKSAYSLEMINIELSDSDKQTMAGNRAVNRKTNLLLEHTKFASRVIDVSNPLHLASLSTPSSSSHFSNQSQKHLSFVFQANPTAVIPSTEPNGLTNNGMEFTYMIKGDDGSFKPTGPKFSLPPQHQGDEKNDTIIITSIGYQTVGLDGVPFDPKRNIYPTDRGRVISNQSQPSNGLFKTTFNRHFNTSQPGEISNTSQSTQNLHPTTQPTGNAHLNTTPLSQLPEAPPGYDIVPFVYATGWARRGPVGILGTNIGDAKETATSVVHDLTSLASLVSADQNAKGDGVVLESTGPSAGLPPLPLPSQLWAKTKVFVTSQNEWGAIQMHEQGQAHCLGVKSWIHAENDGAKKAVQSVFEGDFNAASVKENNWDVIRKAAKDQIM